MAGLADDIGYSLDPPNALQRVVQRIGSTAVGSRIFAAVLPRLDPVVYRLSGRRMTLPSLLAGLPVLMVTTTGARSGLERTAPLVGIPLDSDIALIGTNFGQASTPAWVYNLDAQPAGSIGYGERSVRFVARRLSGDEAETALAAGAEFYAGYAAYRERIRGREVAVFLLSRKG
jgi:deazaflavin-dependent oxidoreductase (nitroreductase family)